MPENQQSDFRRVTDFLPPISPSSTDLESPSQGSAFSPEEIKQAFGFHLRRHLKAGWAFAEGLLSKGKVKKQVPTYITGRQGTVEFNPLKDAFALRLGAKFVRPNRYLMPSGVLVDANGSAQDPSECPGCGSTKTFDNRFFVATRSTNPFAKPWEHAWTYCKVCVTPEEIERLKRLAEGSAPTPKRYGR